MISPSDLTRAAKEAAIEAGELLAQGFGTSFTVETKTGGRQNLVTEYDRAAEKLIMEFLREKTPECSFLAEESGSIPSASSDLLWIIDPLDGTVNFAHQVPVFSVSIAAVQNREIVAGVVYNPLVDELFTATKGEGAFLNDKKLKVSKNTTPDKAMLATGFPTNVEDDPRRCIETFDDMLRRGFPIRRLGSACLDLAYIAAGRFDAFWEVILHPWDIAAGRLLIEEAGGKITDYAGKPLDPVRAGPVLATNGLLHPFMLEVVARP